MGRQDSAVLLEQGSGGGERQGAPRHRSRVAAAWMQLEEEEDPRVGRLGLELGQRGKNIKGELEAAARMM
jgi:hypothetical protein